MNKKVTIFTDGSCLGNPGSGGWAAILQYESSSGQVSEKELGGGFALTTNNRMEITAAIEGLSALKEPCIVSIVTDSQYLRQAVEKKWLEGWIKNGWKTANKKPVKNQDLWMKLNELLSKHEVHFSWVRGHNGHSENERCDEIARTWAQSSKLPQDTGFISE